MIHAQFDDEHLTMPSSLSAADKRRLRTAAHALKPVVMIGQHGYTAAVGAAIDEALTAHELIKVRVRGIDSRDRDALAERICDEYSAVCVGIIGGVMTLYRKNPDSDQKLKKGN